MPAALTVRRDANHANNKSIRYGSTVALVIVVCTGHGEIRADHFWYPVFTPLSCFTNPTLLLRRLLVRLPFFCCFILRPTLLNKSL